MTFVEPTDKEKQTVEELRQRLEKTPDLSLTGHHITDICILRFLRGCKGKEDKAYTELVRYIGWRIESDADNIDNYIPQFQRRLDNRLIILGNVDKENRPVAFSLVHKFDNRDREIEEMRLFIIYALESLLKRTNPEQEMFAAVADLSRFTMRCIDYEVIKMGINILQGNYPDTLGKLLIVDSPMIFSACWAIIRPWLDPVTASKVQFIRRSQLEDFIDPSQIPLLDD
jgi:hypothetical protein